MTMLIVVAHPDDEVLGCGATGAAVAAAGGSVRTCMLSGDAAARGARPSSSELRGDLDRAQELLGFGTPIVGAFPNIQLNTVPHIELVRFIEDAIQQTGAQTVLTHHPRDVNDDHVQTSRACQAAVRLFQRRAGVPPLRRLLFMEILSSTDWSFRTGSPGFEPDTFVEVGEHYLERKRAALRAYRGVMRPFPHPRSDEIIQSLAAYRGGQAGMRYAEAFQSAFAAVRSPDELK